MVVGFFEGGLGFFYCCSLGILLNVEVLILMFINSGNMPG